MLLLAIGTAERTGRILAVLVRPLTVAVRWWVGEVPVAAAQEPARCADKDARAYC